MSKILITGVAGFIGFHVAKKLLSQNKKVIGIDNLNDYYDIKIKKDRLNILKKDKNFLFLKDDLNNKNLYKKLRKYFNDINIVIHMAGQAGVRYSIFNPETYIMNNILAYVKLLQFFKNSKKLKVLLYASSSSVYGEKGQKKLSNFNVNKPESIYSASKISMELISNVYAKLYKINLIGLRFFTVYGPWGRPDMSYLKFLILNKNKKHIEIYNFGKHQRSFTYIDDLISNLFKIMNFYKRYKKKGESQVFNLGNEKNIKLMDFIKTLEKITSIRFRKKFLKKQMGDVEKTGANLKIEKKKFDLKFDYTLEKGLIKFYDWFKNY
jgi:UDP-glucuronate 4-epimerase